jgi:hypothetical protein
MYKLIHENVNTTNKKTFTVLLPTHLNRFPFDKVVAKWPLCVDATLCTISSSSFHLINNKLAGSIGVDRYVARVPISNVAVTSAALMTALHLVTCMWWYTLVVHVFTGAKCDRQEMFVYDYSDSSVSTQTNIRPRKHSADMVAISVSELSLHLQSAILSYLIFNDIPPSIGELPNKLE